MEWLVLMFFFGLSAGAIGKIKGSSFFLWFLVCWMAPVLGTIAAILYRFERDEPRPRSGLRVWRAPPPLRRVRLRPAAHEPGVQALRRRSATGARPCPWK